MIDPLQEAIWELSYYNNERALRELCKDCSSLTPINPTITEDMVNLSREELDAARQLAQSGKPVNSWNIDRVKNGQIDDIDPVADPARGDPSETTRPKPTQPTETQWNDFNKNGDNNTIWDAIKPTQDNYPGSVIPRSFEITLPNGETIWVHGNATEHMAEYANYKATNNTPESVRLSSQQELNSLRAALNTATEDGIKYDELMNVDGWELKISPARQPGGLPALIHARPLK